VIKKFPEKPETVPSERTALFSNHAKSLTSKARASGFSYCHQGNGACRKNAV
jgi:hypothetical protein